MEEHIRVVPFLKRLLSSVPAEDTCEDIGLRVTRVSEIYRIYGGILCISGRFTTGEYYR